MNTKTRSRLSKLTSKSILTFLFTLLFLVQSFFNAPILAQGSEYWPQFRGNNCSGLASDSANPPVELNETTLQWKTPLPIGHSSPCIAGDNIFVTAQKDSTELQTICIDRNTGKIKWTQSIFPEKMEGYHSISNAAQTSPATDGERVYVYFGSYGIICYNIHGKLLWDYRIPVHWYRWGVASSPVLFEDKVIISRDIWKDWYLLALNKYTGDSLWKVVHPTHTDNWTTNWATPVIYKNQIILHRCNEISSYSITNGNRLWWLPYLSAGVSTPVINENIIYVGTWHNSADKENRANFPDYFVYSKLVKDFDNNKDGLIQKDELPDTLYAYIRPAIKDYHESTYSTVKKMFGYFDKDKNNCINKTEWEETTSWLKTNFYKEAGMIAINPTGRGELSNEHIIWKEPEKTPEVPSPIFYNNKIYMCKNGGILTCMDALSGKIHFQERIGVGGAYFSSPVVANGNIYIAANNGKIVVIKASAKFEVIAKNDVEGKIFATPAILGDKIYIRTINYLFAFGQASKQTFNK